MLSIFRQITWRTGRMNTSEKEFEMIYLLIKLLTVYIFQEICPITRTWRLQDFFQGLTKDFIIFSLYQRLKKLYKFIFYNKNNTPAGCWQELKKFAKNWTFARRLSWQSKINWGIFVWYMSTEPIYLQYRDGNAVFKIPAETEFTIILNEE